MTEILILIALVSAGVVHGTDAFFFVVGRPALERTSETALTETMGRLHQVADTRMPIFGVYGLVSTLALAFVSRLGSATSYFAFAALLGLLLQLVLYLTVAQPINKQLTRAAEETITLENARALQRRWDSVIGWRALGTTVAMICLTLAATRL
jgi:Domain of unknown function (DUF1772)